jgi:hypothetical protein
MNKPALGDLYVSANDPILRSSIYRRVTKTSLEIDCPKLARPCSTIASVRLTPLHENGRTNFLFRYSGLYKTNGMNTRQTAEKDGITNDPTDPVLAVGLVADSVVLTVELLEAVLEVVPVPFDIGVGLSDGTVTEVELRDAELDVLPGTPDELDGASGLSSPVFPPITSMLCHDPELSL